ncbi:hypothetical protein [Fodinicurvata sediminis]|uniref:hypothetical protein n=1 Tax=Fodinicurvata sediminis TaxID=1121832 RepID=UPI0003B4A18C|nr:hypothetical protein [Fodinicurvata sediminis]
MTSGPLSFFRSRIRKDPRRELTQAATVLETEEFNLWCAMNDRPFRLRLVEVDGEQPEWCIEAEPGTANARIVYATGTGSETAAVAVAYGFVAGVEWLEVLQEAEQQEAEEAEAEAFRQAESEEAGDEETQDADADGQEST